MANVGSSSRTLRFEVGTPRLAVIRDWLLVALCVTLIVGFLAQVWRGPAPAGHRSVEQAMLSAGEATGAA